MVSSGWSWNSALETLFGTASGALIGVGGIAWQIRVEKHERYETHLTQKLFDLIDSIQVLLPTSFTPRKSYQREVLTVSLALSNISMIARKEEREFIQKLGELCNVEKAFDLKTTTDSFAFIVGTIIGWRNEYNPPKFYEDAIDKRLKNAELKSQP